MKRSDVTLTYPPLLPDELDILKMIQNGKSYREIAHSLGKDEKALKAQVKDIMKKMEVSNRKDLVDRAVSMGALPISPARYVLSRQKVKVGIVGCGKGGKAILEIFKDDKFIKVVGVADSNPLAHGIAVAKKLKIPVFEDYTQLFRKNPDIIINVTGSKEVRDEIRRIKPPDVELMEGLSALLLWQLVEERRKRAEDRERVLKEHESLYHLGLVIESIDSMKDAGYAIIDYATRLTSTPAGSLALFDERKEDMVLVASKGFSSDFKKIDRWEIRKGGLTSYILNQNAPVIIHDLERFRDPNPVLLREGVRSLLASPLTVDGRIVGILYVNDFKPRRFRAEDLSLFSLLTIYAALTIERVKSIEEMRLMSITDGLTGLYNHRYLMEQMQNEVQRASRHNHSFSIIMLDIDQFKDYNDKFGHLEGNKVLKGIARLLVRTSRSTDTVGRFGGEEFCIILHDMKKDGAVAFSKRLLQEVDKYHAPNRKITLSGGIATYPKDGKTHLELIKVADARLYMAKKEGRNRIYFE